MAKKILIVDDEPSIRTVLSAHLRKFGFEVETAEDGAEGITALQEDLFHLVVTDLKMPLVDGMALLRWCSENQPGLPVILITAHGTVDTAVEAIKRGAFDYIAKPFERDELHAIISKALATEARRSQQLHEAPSRKYSLIGSTPAMRELYKLVEKVAPSPSTVLITGESGTGKEVVARALHENSDRSEQAFIEINCGAIPEQLCEAELFGYEKGAFTGAVTSKPGRFELADKGTLFLDEVGEIPREMQVKLLRSLQTREIDRVGGLRTIPIDVRIIAATNTNLKQAVADGLFREDLFYRLNVIPISLPPLRDRLEDIPLLVEHFIKKFNKRLGREVQRVDGEALAALLEYHWPGNIRELENLMERSILLAEDEIIRTHDLPGLSDTVENPLQGGDLDDLGLKEYVRVHTVKLERRRIQRVLEAEDGNVTRAARKLGISRKSLQVKMKDYGLRDV